MMRGTDPRDLLKDMISADSVIPDHLDQLTLWKIILNMVTEPPRRRKLANVNTLQDVVSLIQTSQRIIVLTGAGVSVSCGIPDFRSRDGVYARLAVDFPDLPDPQAMFDISYFRKDPRPFFKFAKEIYPGQFRPSPCHRFIRCLEKHGRLLRHYTQNIDTLEQVVGISNVVQCHGSFATATCTQCRAKVSADDIKEDIFQQHIPYCQTCSKDYKEPEQDATNNIIMNNGVLIQSSPGNATPGISRGGLDQYTIVHNYVIGSILFGFFVVFAASLTVWNMLLKDVFFDIICTDFCTTLGACSSGK
jgi:NAD-dependent deacetylase sirtuin 1